MIEAVVLRHVIRCCTRHGSGPWVCFWHWPCMRVCCSCCHDSTTPVLCAQLQQHGVMLLPATCKTTSCVSSQVLDG
jgi:hypothetical protein